MDNTVPKKTLNGISRVRRPWLRQEDKIRRDSLLLLNIRRWWLAEGGTSGGKVLKGPAPGAGCSTTEEETSDFKCCRCAWCAEKWDCSSAFGLESMWIESEYHIIHKIYKWRKMNAIIRPFEA